ncbi:MAG: hypothetical protein M3R17_04360 [Bacteroidota bacterium]|nr:hypothetical protein [Bacteroidota bacterium]
MLLLIVPSCKLFHFDKLHPSDDFISDHLGDYRINKISIIVSDSVKIYPGASFPIDVVAVTAGKKQLKTRGLPNGFVNWNSYAVRVEGGTFSKGIVTVNADPRNTGNPFKFFVYPYYYPDVKSEIILSLSYKAKFIADCRGQKGANGINGPAGGAADSLRFPPVYKGRRGAAGTNGETGSDGCLADVFVKAMMVNDKEIMNVLVVNHCDNSHSVFWVDPDGGSLVVDVSGGNGGNGGNGGDGEKGMDGTGYSFYWVDPGPSYPETVDDPKFNHNGYFYLVDLVMDSTKNPSGNGSNGGIGGNGAHAGNGGNGGVVIIHFDSSAVQWENKITINNSGGKPGKPGTGGYAGSGGDAAYGMQSKVNGKTGYIGADGIKGKSGKPGTPAIQRIEKLAIRW